MLSNDIQVEELAKKFSKQIIENKQIVTNKTIEKIEINELNQETDYQNVDVNSIASENAREIGAEWIAKQAIEQVGLDKIIESQNASQYLLKTTQISIISRMVHPASERETERWLNDNTALNQLFELSEDQVSRHDLCRAAEFLYDKKRCTERSRSGYY